MIRKITSALGVCSLLISSTTSFAVENIAVEVGYGEDRTYLLRVAIDDPWRKRPAWHDWQLAGYLEYSAALWDNLVDSTADVGVTPVFRVQRSSIYVEGAIGFHLVQTHISAARSFSTALQFAEHVGAGVRLRNYDIGVALQHLSNGGLRQPNPGISFALMRLRYALE